MGSFFSKGHSEEDYIPHGPEVDFMTRTHGKACCKHLVIWHHKFGFPRNGSLDPEAIESLEKQLLEQKAKLLKASKITPNQYKAMEEHEDAFKLWKREKDVRNSRELSRLQMVHKVTTKKQIQNEKTNLSSPSSPPHAAAPGLSPTAPPSSSYVALYPSLPQQQPPSYSSVKAKKIQARDHVPFWADPDLDSFLFVVTPKGPKQELKPESQEERSKNKGSHG